MLLSLHTSPFRIASCVKLIGVKQRVSGNGCVSFKIKREVSFWTQIRAPLTIFVRGRFLAISTTELHTSRK